MDPLQLLGQFGDWAWNVFGSLWGWFKNHLAFLQGVFSDVGKFFQSIWAHLRKVWQWAAGIQHTALWQELQKWYKRYQQFLALYQKYVLDPMLKLQAFIFHIYNTIFGPLLAAMNVLTQMTQVIAIFNKKLAAKIDDALWNLERKLTAPINWLIERVDAVSQFLLTTFDELGLIQKFVLLGSIAAHWGDIQKQIAPSWLQTGIAPPEPALPQWKRAQDDYEQYLSTGGGPLQPHVQAYDDAYAAASINLGLPGAP